MSSTPARETFGTKRKAAIFANVVLMGVLAIAAAVIVVYLTGFTTVKARFDLTRQGTYTLSAETERLLASMEQDVEIVTVFDRSRNFWWDTEQVRVKAMDFVADLLQEYKVRGGGKVAVTHLDPITQNAAILDLFQQLGIRDYNVVIVRSATGQRRVLGLETDLVDLDFGAPEPFRPMQLLAYRVEEGLSGAIFEVTQGKPAKVYVTNGHGELSLNDARDRGLTAVAALLTQDNVVVEPLALNVAKAIPGDADAVLILGPVEPFLPDERAAVESYLRTGRARVIVAIDPFGDTSLDPLWKSVGIELERNVVCHDQGGTMQAVGASELVIGPQAPGRYGAHPIVDALNENQRYVVMSRSMGLRAVAGAENTFTSLMTSHADSWGDLPATSGGPGNYKWDANQEAKGQRTLAALVEPRGPFTGAKIVFFGSDRWAWNAFLSASLNQHARGHFDLVRRAVSWLVGRKKSIELAPRRVQQVFSDLRPEEYDDILLYIVVYLPLAALGLTILVWFARRR